MNEQERREAIWRLYNPQTPNPFVSWDYGVLVRDLPPRRTLRERLAASVWLWRQVWGRPRPEERD